MVSGGTNGGDFFERIDHLSDAVGHGHLVGTIVVDQIYAHNQHEHPEYNHPRGGQAYYLRDPLFADSDSMHQRLADHAITEDGSELESAMADNMEHMSDKVHELAPVEYYHLKRSGHPSVTSDGATVYDREPEIHRLSEQELAALSESREKHPDR